MKLFPGATRFQRWTMGATFLIVATYAISQNKQSLVEVSKTRLSSPSPGIIDGDTIDFPNGRVRVVGIDAPDDDLPQLKAISSEALRGLALRDGGMDCSVSMFDYALRREKQRSEAHTSELQSLMRISYAVFCLKKKKQQ